MGHGRTCSQARCPECRIHKYLCFCKEIIKIEYPTEIVIIMHKAETHLTSNTAKLAINSLKNSSLRVRGLKDHPLTLDDLHDGKENLLLFPSEDSEELKMEHGNHENIRLIVPDGSWGQAKSIAKREPFFKTIKKVRLPVGKLSEYQLRSEPSPASVSTFEAIERAIEILHPNQGTLELKKYFKIMVERNLWAKTMIHESQCTYPIPQKALDYRYRPHLFVE